VFKSSHFPEYEQIFSSGALPIIYGERRRRTTDAHTPFISSRHISPWHSYPNEEHAPYALSSPPASQAGSVHSLD